MGQNVAQFRWWTRRTIGIEAVNAELEEEGPSASRGFGHRARWRGGSITVVDTLLGSRRACCMNRVGAPPFSAFPGAFALPALIGLIGLSIAGSPAAFAQAVPDPRTQIALPNSQSAAVEDATALLVNPAGIAFVEGFELNLGGFVRANEARAQTDLDATVVTTPLSGFGLGLGAGLTVADGSSSVLRTSAALALAAGHSLSLGAALHGFTSLSGGSQPDWLVDVGAQIRPARWMALGLGIEGLGGESVGALELAPASARLGLSLRPVGEIVTVGVDARLVPGSRDIGSSRYAGEATVVPGAAVRVDLGGLALSVGASMSNLGANVPGDPELEVNGVLEINGGHLGATLLGGVDSILADSQGGAGGARLRASSARWTSLFPEKGRWLSFRLEGEGVQAEDDDGSLLSQLFAEEPRAMNVLAALHNAIEDESIDGVVLELRGLQLGWGRLAELRTALAGLRDAGKKVVVYLDGGDDGDVFLASIADRVYLTPAGSLDFNGLRAEMTYFGDTLEKIGVEVEAVSAGRYKSAPRQFTSDEPSPEEIEVQNALLDGVFGALTESVAAGRGLKVEEVKAIIDRGGLTSTEALEARIIDGVAYRDELKARVEELAGHPVFLEERVLRREERVVRWDTPPRIAVIPVEGTIAMAAGLELFDGGAGAQDIIDALENASSDPDVRAIVLRIDSPGGDALASDLIWRAVIKARDKKPVIASLGDVAASGGYYVASAAHTILAEPNTITGSIGVFGLLFNIERLADDWGVRAYPLERGAVPGPSIFRSLDETERAALQRSVDATYDRFLEAVITGRGQQSGLDKEALRAVADGRVWTGSQAQERKLVDSMGGILDALAEARKRAGLSEDEPIALDVMTGGGGDFGRLTGLARLFASPDRDGMARAVRLLLGDPAALGFALDHEGRPLAVSPVSVHVE